MLRAYLLALFSHMVAKLVGDLYFSLHGPEAMSDLFESEAKVIEEDKVRNNQKLAESETKLKQVQMKNLRRQNF